MKKFIFVIFCTLLLVPALVFSNVNTAISARAEKITASELEYFELNKPVSVFRDGEIIYIAEKELVVIYHDDTYDKIDFTGFNIRHIEKCGNHLLVLSERSLYTINLATHEIALLTYEADGQPLPFNDVNSFAVNDNNFAVSTGENLITIYEVTDGENFLFQPVKTSITQTVSSSDVLAFGNDLSIFYFSSKMGQINQISNAIGMQGPYEKISLTAVDQFFFHNDTLFYKANDVVYRIGTNLRDLPQASLNLEQFGILQSGGFTVNGNMLLICDTQNDRVLEFDLTTQTATGFEISFTKISLPNDFELSLCDTPTYVDVSEGVKLYDINLTQSFEKGYFVFNGYHTQQSASEYLVLKEVSSLYYLIAGDCIALVMMNDFTPKEIPLWSQFDTSGYASNEVTSYIYPRLTNEFRSDKIGKHQPLEVVKTFTFRDCNYSLVKFEQSMGYIPSSFILPFIYQPPVLNDYETGVTSNKPTPVYDGKDLTNKVDELEDFSKVVVLEAFDDALYVRYADGKTGYIPVNTLSKQGYVTDKIVATVIMLALALTITAIHFELKYLYSKKKLPLPIKRK